MSKKLMLLAAGALTALAFAALPAVSSAGEWETHCEKLPCTASVQSTGTSKFSITNGDTVWCESVTGTVTQSALTSSTTTANLTFHECREQATPFHFLCTNNGLTAGTVNTGNQTSHNIYLDAAKTKKGAIVTGVNTTFTCAGGFASTTVTGEAMGEFENITCGVATSELTLNFEATHGHQAWNKITATAPIRDLFGATNHSSGGTYETAAQTGTAHLIFNQKVTPTC